MRKNTIHEIILDAIGKLSKNKIVRDFIHENFDDFFNFLLYNSKYITSKSNDELIYKLCEAGIKFYYLCEVKNHGDNI